MGFIREDNKTNGNNNNSEIKTISSKVLGTVPASDIKLGNSITVNNVSINKDRRYYIEFLGIKKLCSLSVDEELGNAIICGIGNYGIDVCNDSTNISIGINKINEDDTTTDTFTDLVIYEEEVKCLDNKYLENDLVLQNSISMGRVGDIGYNSSAIGYKVKASGSCSHAEGQSTISSGLYSHAEGGGTEASGSCSHSEGSDTVASGDTSHAEGNSTTASGDYGSHAEGSDTVASGLYSHAEGSDTEASGDSSHAEGNNTHATGENSHAEGKYTEASGESSHAEGDNTHATGNYSHAEGGGTTASGNYSHAEGSGTTASSQFQHVQGKYNIEDTANKYAHIVGNGEDGKDSNAHTLDWEGNAWYAGQVEGTNLPYTISSKVLITVPASDINLDDDNITVNNVSFNKDRRYYIEFLGSKKLCSISVDEELGNSIICNIGNYIIEAYTDSTNISLSINKIKDTTTDTFTDLVIYEEEVKCLNNKYLETDLTLQNSISLGRIGDIGVGSSAIGNRTTASGAFSHAVGINTTASGDFSHAEGEGAKALGKDSHAEGNNTTASGNYGSHAEGYNTKASGNASHAEGDMTTASGLYSHAEGGGTITSGTCSHAEGYNTKALGNFSHAEGNMTTASSDSQHVQGKYNIEDTANKYAHIVGNGDDDDTRSNAHTLDWEGNAWYSGEVYVGGNSQDDGKKLLSTADIYFDENGKLCITINGVTKKFTPDSE